ncbi:MAG: A/G-specific adenine glycosylase [Sphingobacteriales bacterium]|nr:MAG: A/G-specific adenine glycosylase [Sphingobacteriales bacterium]
MDFGAIVCKPQNPLCSQCPQQQDCQAFNLGSVKDLPVKGKKLTRKHRWFYYFMIEKPGTTFIRKRTANDIWQNLHEFILHETSDPETFPHKSYLKQLLGDQHYVVTSQSRIYVQHLTHQTIHGQFIQVSAPSDITLPPAYIEVPTEKLRTLAFPRMINRFLETEVI